MGFIKSAVKELVLLLALNIVLVPFMVFAPLIFVVLPLLLIFDNPSGDFSGLAQFFFWTGPLSCALWMLLSCHWQSVRHWRRMGRLDTCQQDHGGLVRTVTKATGYMFGGLFASFFFEMVFLCVFRFAPVILLWLVRWRRSRKDQGWIVSTRAMCAVANSGEYGWREKEK